MIDIGARDLEAFVTLAQICSYTNAAATLGMTQSTLSKKIKELELKLQVRLFDRTTRQVILTPEGQNFLEHARSLLDQFQRSFEDVREQAGGKRGRLSLACGPHMSGNLLPPVIAQFSRHHPDVDVVLFDCRSHETLRYILSEQVEIGVTVHAPDMVEHPQVSYTRVVERCDPLMVAFPRRHPLQHLAEVSLEDLRPFRVLMLRGTSAVGHLVETATKHHGINYDHTLEVSLIHTALGLAASDYGIVILPSYVRSQHREDNLVYRSISGTSAKFHFSLQHLHGRSLSGPAKAFARQLREHIQNW